MAVLKENLIIEGDQKNFLWYDKSDIELIIGTDVPQVMEAWNIISSQDNRPLNAGTAVEYSRPIAVSVNKVVELKNLFIWQSSDKGFLLKHVSGQMWDVSWG